MRDEDSQRETVGVAEIARAEVADLTLPTRDASR